jgi:hypothetical protein
MNNVIWSDYFNYIKRKIKKYIINNEKIRKIMKNEYDNFMNKYMNSKWLNKTILKWIIEKGGKYIINNNYKK